MMRNDFGNRKHILSASSVWKISVFDVGLQYSVSKNNYTAIGVYGKIKLGPVSGYLSSDNIVGIFRPFDSKSASARLGLILQF